MTNGSDRIEQIRAFLNECANQGHYTPTLDEIGAAVGLSAKSAVKHHVDALVAEGFCQRIAGRLRLQKREPMALFFAMPILNGHGKALLVPSVCKLADGQLYRVEVYAHD